MPLLANDPHLGASLPSVWHQVGLKCRAVTPDCAFDVAGFGFSGVPGVVIGHNDRIAWGFTNLTTDVTDLYLEKIEGDQYWRDGALVPLEERTETIEVAGGEDVELVIRSTVHGPIISGLTDDFTAIAADPYTGTDGVDRRSRPRAPEGEYAVSLQWTALEPGTTAAAIFALNVAQDFDDFRAAAQLFDVPAQNLIYADVDGNIGYQTPGKLPIRGAGDGSMPQPGWDSAYDWQGFIPFEELPDRRSTPTRATSSRRTTRSSARTTRTSSRATGTTAGARRASSTCSQRKIARGPAHRRRHARHPGRQRVLRWACASSAAYTDVVDGRQGPDAALDLLRSWDAQNNADSDAAAYANVLWDELVQDLFVRGREHRRAGHRTGPPVPRRRRACSMTRSSEWWTNDELGVAGQERDARARGDPRPTTGSSSCRATTRRSGTGARCTRCRCASDTFGSSGIAPIEMLFNRGPFPVGGGSSVVERDRAGTSA